MVKTWERDNLITPPLQWAQVTNTKDLTRHHSTSRREGGMANRKLIYLLLPALTLMGCAMTAIQRQQVATFGKATAVVGDFAKEQLPQVREQVIAMNAAGLILSTDEWTSTSGRDLDKPLRADSATTRVATARALQSYGELLNQLATADKSADIKKAAQDVITNFDSALGAGYSADQKNAAVGLLSSLGNMWVEHKKREAVATIVEEYEPAVEALANLLAEDFNQHGDGYLSGLAAVAGKLENTSVGTLKGSNQPTFEQRAYAVKAFIAAEKAKKQASELGTKATTVIKDLKKANADLKRVMKQGKYTAEDIKAYAKSVEQLVNTAKVLSGR